MSIIKRMKRISLFIFILLISIWSTGYTSSDLISYQGRLTLSDGNPVSNGQHAMQFAIYDDSLGGQMLWTETSTIVTLYGMFTHLLGTDNSFPDNLFTRTRNLFLEVVFADESILPRSLLTGVPSALVTMIS